MRTEMTSTISISSAWIVTKSELCQLQMPRVEVHARQATENMSASPACLPFVFNFQVSSEKDKKRSVHRERYRAYSFRPASTTLSSSRVHFRMTVGRVSRVAPGRWYGLRPKRNIWTVDPIAAFVLSGVSTIVSRLAASAPSIFPERRSAVLNSDWNRAQPGSATFVRLVNGRSIDEGRGSFCKSNKAR